MLIVGSLIVAAGLGLYEFISLKKGEQAGALINKRVALGKAEAALRIIANGSSNPVLEAQIALDEINNHYNKEIS